MKERIAGLLIGSGLHSAAGPLVRLRGGCVVLMYHRVLPERDRFHPSVSYEEFAADIRFVARNFTPIRLSSLAGDFSPGGSIAVTIDDGYREIYDFVYPLVRKEGVPVTAFLVSDLVGTEGVLWTTELAEIIRGAPGEAVELEALGGKRFLLGDVNEKVASLGEIKGLVKSAPAAAVEIVLCELREKLGPAGRRGGRMLLWEEIAEMSPSCIEFGSHTRSHPLLSRVGPRRARDEILGSKEAIESRVGREILSFCYPNGQEGDFTEETKAMVREAGYDIAVTAMPGAVTRSSDRYALKRLWTERCSRENLHARIYRSLLFPGNA